MYITWRDHVASCMRNWQVRANEVRHSYSIDICVALRPVSALQGCHPPFAAEQDQPSMLGFPPTPKLGFGNLLIHLPLGSTEGSNCA
jgi:hypothetical protein